MIEKVYRSVEAIGGGIETTNENFQRVSNWD